MVGFSHHDFRGVSYYSVSEIRDFRYGFEVNWWIIDNVLLQNIYIFYGKKIVFMMLLWKMANFNIIEKRSFFAEFCTIFFRLHMMKYNKTIFWKKENFYIFKYSCKTKDLLDMIFSIYIILEVVDFLRIIVIAVLVFVLFLFLLSTKEFWTCCVAATFVHTSDKTIKNQWILPPS